MSGLHGALRAMPWYIVATIAVMLLVASSADNEVFGRGSGDIELQRSKPWQTRVVDNLGSWLALAALLTGTVAYYWPT